MEKQRLSSIDMMKTIAIFFVIIYHGALFSNDFLEKADLICYGRYYVRTILSTCTPLFFFVNGYLLFGKSFDLQKHVYKMVRLTALSVIWAIIALLFLQIIHDEYLSLIDFIKAIWHWKVGWINYLWYMGALVCIYVFFPLLKNAYDTSFKTFLYFTILCCLFTFGNAFLNHAGTVFSGLLLKEPVVFSGENFFNIYNPFRGIHGFTFGYFCIGGVVHHFQSVIERINVRTRNLLAVLGIALSCLGLFWTGICYSKAEGSVWSVVWQGYDSIFTLINVLCIFILCLNWKKDSRMIREISGNTLGIYFIHYILISALRPQIQRYDFLSTFSFTVVFASVVLTASLMICLVMKKCPVLSKLI